jgi:hypothetical protein
MTFIRGNAPLFLGTIIFRWIYPSGALAIVELVHVDGDNTTMDVVEALLNASGIRFDPRRAPLGCKQRVVDREQHER